MMLSYCATRKVIPLWTVYCYLILATVNTVDCNLEGLSQNDLPISDRLQIVQSTASDPSNGALIKYMYHGRQFDTIHFNFLMSSSEFTLLKPKNSTCAILKGPLIDKEDFKHFTFYSATCTIKRYEDFTVSVVGEDKKTSLSFNDDLSTTCHSSLTSVWQFQLTTSNEHLSINNFLLCKNGSLFNIQQSNILIHECTTLYLIKNLQPCLEPLSQGKKVCSISSWKSEGEDLKLHLLNSPSGSINIITDTDKIQRFCNSACEFKVRAINYISLTCTDGSQDFKQVHKEVVESCPFITSSKIGYLALTFCRLSTHPLLLWFLVLWIILGYPICILFSWISTKLYRLSIYVFRYVSIKKCINHNICYDCNSEYKFDNLIELHSTCINGICPYCRVGVGENVIDHVKSCKSKVYRYKEQLTLLQSNSKLEHGAALTVSIIRSKLTIITIYILVLLFAMVPMTNSEHFIPNITDQYGHVIEFNTTAEDYLSLFKSTDSLLKPAQGNDYYSKLASELKRCDFNCFHVNNECQCEDRRVHRFKRDLSSNNLGHYPIVSPKGFINYNSTYQPTSDDETIQLTFNTITKTPTTSVVSGESIYRMPFQNNEGISFRISTDEDFEVKTISVSLHDAFQVYKSKFVKWVSDRTLKISEEFGCTGSCDDLCKCEISTCKVAKWQDDRGWGCNPSWCWSISDGCTCCKASALENFSSGLLGIWEVELSYFGLTLCLSDSMLSYKCKYLEGPGTFLIGKYELSIGNPTGNIKKVSKFIATKHNVGQTHSNIDQIVEIYSDPNICYQEHCTHGEIGDYSFRSIEDISTYADKKPTTYMVWKTTSLSRQCSFGNYPKCYSDDMVSSLSDKFDYFYKNKQILKNDFRIVTSTLNQDRSGNPSLVLKVQPKMNYGYIEGLIKVRGLELQHKSVSVKVDTYILKTCGGCRNCRRGFWCTLRLSISEPLKFNIHLYSEDPTVAIDTRTIEVGRYPKDYNVSMFTPILIREVKICIKEVDMCKTIKNISLDEPSFYLTHQGDSIYSSLPNKTYDGQNLFYSIYGGIKATTVAMFDVIRGFWSNIYIVLMVASVLVLLIFLKYLGLLRLVFDVLTCGFCRRKVRYNKSAEKKPLLKRT
ncbi:glycoprotein precursor [Sanxia Water Strider Virus 1]|uniref:Glycoprotein n=1 Tax=Sanxia Water Strider Virus 1 TaxID=1608060 RepID=A0A0B5KS14_9VIRU|nr:glycoprotein precursor [Sanxia Water Strider Virus 1]AJG39281.1 glycoprotein precursor [Sanxia Water Strider Virus 1]APG79322.1 putative glycoprotein [Sanxia Water Strider Virus 1]